MFFLFFLQDADYGKKDAGQMWSDLRVVQRRTFCSTKTLEAVAGAVCPALNIRTLQRQTDRKLNERAGAVCLQLHGCVWCNKFVFLPDNKACVCPKCGGARYNEDSVPYEVCTYFPLEPQVRKLLELPNFRWLLGYEYRRPANPKFMTDVYDSPMWHKLFGPPDAKQIRVVLQLAVDGIPAFSVSNGVSVKPWGYMILSLAPHLRVRAGNFLLQCLIPSRLKGQAAKKYYDFAAYYEMNRLHDEGIDGVRVVVYGTTLDTPARAELLQLQVCVSVSNMCLICIIQCV